MATVVGLFDNLTTAQGAVDALVGNGFHRYEISLMANATSNEYARYFTKNDAVVSDAPMTASEGAGVGVMAGAVTGLIVGLAAFVIPGIGPIIAAGPLLAGLTGGALGAVAGAATGGLVAALIHAGVPEEEANLYAESVRRGGTLVLVRTTDENLTLVKDIMRARQATDVTQRPGDRQTDPTLVDTPVKGTHVDYPVGSTSFEFFDEECRRHFASHYSNTSYTYKNLRPFYEYGFNLGSDPRYLTATWAEVEADANRYWAENNPNDAWSNYNDAVHFGWDCVRRSTPAKPIAAVPVI